MLGLRLLQKGDENLCVNGNFPVKIARIDLYIAAITSSKVSSVCIFAIIIVFHVSPLCF